MKTTQYKLSELLEIKNGRDHQLLSDGDIPVYGSGGVIRHVSSYLHEGESILLPRKGTLANIQLVRGKFWTVDTTYYAIIDSTKANTYYLYRYLNNLDLSGLDTGVSIPSMTTRTYYSIKVEIPDLPTQQRIAEILSSYDDLIENNNKRISLLEKAAQEVYKEWFVRFRFPGHETAKWRNGLPEGWEFKKIRCLVNRLPYGILYKSGSALPEGKVIIIDQSQDACAGFHNNMPTHIASAEKPIALFGDHSCKYQLMITPFSLSENVVPYVAKGDMPTIYLYYVLYGLVETTEYKRHWTELMSKKVLVALPAIQLDFSKRIQDYLILIESLKKQNINLAKQRDLLLPRLMSGKLEV